MSLKLTTSLSQRLVLTPQLRQRIEMLQMTTLELSELIQQQMLENPVLEEVATQEEAHELAEKILDHLASADATTMDHAADADLAGPALNGSGDHDVVSTLSDAEGSGEAQEFTGAAAATGDEGAGEESVGDAENRDAFEEEIG